MKTRNYLILGAIVVGLGDVTFNVISTGTDNNSDAVTESATENVEQPATTVNPTTTVKPATAVGGDINDVESPSKVTTEDGDNN